MDIRKFGLPGIGALATISLLLSTPAISEIYQWTDAQGNVHFSDRVPADHKDTADSVELSVRIPDDQAVQDAQHQAQRIQNAAENTAMGNMERSAEQNQTDEDPTANRQTARQQHFEELSPLPTRATRAERLERYELEMERYRASMQCFAPYRNRNGSFKVEAYDRCEIVQRPQQPD